MVRTEQFIIVASGVLMGTFLFAALMAAKLYKIEVPECVPADELFESGEVIELDPATYQIKYVASMWTFDPLEVRLPVGAEVDIYLTSADVVHGFNIPKKNVNLMAVYGAINKTTVKFRKPGVYPIYCHEYCGANHHFMKGKIIIE